MAIASDEPLRGDLPNWRIAGSYDILLDADPYGMAWEWLRRTNAYRSAWNNLTHASTAPPASAFGLERYENPSLPVPAARPIWSSAVYTDVLRAHVSDPFAARRDRVDLRLLSRFVSVAISDDEVEHLLLSDGLHSIRIDVVVGTLIGCPASLTYLLHGLSGLRGPMGALKRLANLVHAEKFEPAASTSSAKRRRWISELRVADATLAGADQQTIAKALFGPAISARRWRSESAEYRRRTQRLVHQAGALLMRPLDRWLQSDHSHVRLFKG
ncbi:DNA -binding domain-containing protein [Sphingomonas oryzagri]